MELDDILVPKKGNWSWRLALAIFSSVLGGTFLYGVAIGQMNQVEDVVRAALSGCDSVENCKVTVTDLEWSLCVSLMPLGGLFGSFVGKLTGRWGPRRLILANSFFFLLGSLMMALARSVAVLTVGRMALGFGSGAATALIPMYLAEIAPPPVRGAVGTLNQFGITMGILLSQIFGMSALLGTLGGWRWLFASTAVPSIISLALVGVMPESPSWLYVTKGREDEARCILQTLRSKHDVDDDMANLQHESNNSQMDRGVRDVLTDRTLRLPLTIGIIAQLGQQLSGINATFYFSSSIFKDANVHNPNLVTTMVGLVNVLMTAVTVRLMDRTGRRPLLLWGLVGMAFSYVLLTISLNERDTGSFFKILSAISVILSVCFFAVGPGAIPWLLIAEIFPRNAQSVAVSLCVAVNWTANFIVGITFTSIQDGLGNESFVPFTVIVLLIALFIAVYVPETKGKSLDEISHLLGRGNKAKSYTFHNVLSEEEADNTLAKHQQHRDEDEEDDDIDCN
eukprot:m.133094 g.133094  ORF g.133094 m.133094 type:complete len:509 (+) comp20088_c0_seq4:154-1680(+)